jgi:hypothetical protein
MLQDAFPRSLIVQNIFNNSGGRSGEDARKSWRSGAEAHQARAFARFADGESQPVLARVSYSELLICRGDAREMPSRRWI